MAVDNRYDVYGFDDDGFDRRGYNVDGYDRNGYDHDGFDVEGFNAQGYDRYGFNRRGFDVDGFNRQGYSNDGYNRDGFDKNGNPMPGITHNSITKSTNPQQVCDIFKTIDTQNRFINVVSDNDFQYLTAQLGKKTENVFLDTQFGQMHGLEIISNKKLITSKSEIYKHSNHKTIMTSNGFEEAIVVRHNESEFKIYRESQNPIHTFTNNISQRVVNSHYGNDNGSDKSHFTVRDFNTVSVTNAKIWHSATNLSELPANQKIMLYSQKCHCYKCAKKFSQDTIVDCTAYVSTKRGNVVPVTAQYCSGCSTFFMNYEVFESYNRKYGGLKFNCELDRSYISRGANIGFADDSFLSRAGYSVKASVSQRKRQVILAELLDSGQATKWEITEKISEFIKLRRGNPDMTNAIACWEEDIAFVADYNAKNQPKAGRAAFKQGGKITR